MITFCRAYCSMLFTFCTLCTYCSKIFSCEHILLETTRNNDEFWSNKMFIFYISVFLFLTEILFDFVLQSNTRTFNFKAKIDNGKFHIIKLRFSHQNVLQRCSQDQNSHFWGWFNWSKCDSSNCNWSTLFGMKLVEWNWSTQKSASTRIKKKWIRAVLFLRADKQLLKVQLLESQLVELQLFDMCGT